MIKKKFISGKGEINTGIIFRIMRLKESIKEVYIEIYNEKIKQDILYTNKLKPLNLSESPINTIFSILTKIEYNGFDDNEIYLIDCYVDK